MRKLSIAVLCAASAACSFVDSALSGASDQAGRNLGASAVGNHATQAPQGAQPASYGGGMSMATMPPAYLNLYMSTIFTYAFSSGGYDVSLVDYKAGEYTRWTGKGQSGKAIWIERAHLFDDAQGRQWWKVKFTDDESRITILEGLLDPAQKRFVRLRARFPDDKQGSEMPVDDQAYYRPPQKLSPESVAGASRGVESVTVPAGTFRAAHVVFGGVDGSHEWWLDRKIPGGTVKQLVKSPHDDQQIWDMELASYGSDAKSELDSK